jgi:hypothetical protein
MRVIRTIYRISPALSALSVLLACADTPVLRPTEGPPPPDLVDLALPPLSGWEPDPEWERADADAFGPFAACPVPVPRVEDGLVEFDTRACEAFSVRAALPTDLARGDLLEVVASHSALQAVAPASGRLHLRLDGEEVWRWTRPIPSTADATTALFEVMRPIPAGRWVGVHVSNHGANQWRLVSLTRYRAP